MNNQTKISDFFTKKTQNTKNNKSADFPIESKD